MLGQCARSCTASSVGGSQAFWVRVSVGCEFGQVSEAGGYPGQAGGDTEVVRGHGHCRLWLGGRGKSFSSHSSGLNFLQTLSCKCNM